MAFEEEEKLFIVSLAEAYEKAASNNDSRVMYDFQQERKRVEGVYEKFCKALDKQFEKKNLEPDEYLGLYRELTEKAMRAFATGNAKELEAFEKDFSKRTDFVITTF